ncbi:RAMP superfamily CRISPR-associated protein [Pantanalinema rosaneae CENA516]|uniref:RAMP superfamily CRISPR-associated protein n=1 Tax=Pantanalinema rosaneae TaxID=1620701 RepID=UPI003D6FD1D7
MSNNRFYRNQRYITKRIIVRGALILDTPTCLSSGDADGLVDLMLLRDSFEEDKALLPGASIAGALRNYLREYRGGYLSHEDSILFGGRKSDPDGDQSPLIVHDALSSQAVGVESRDGIQINNKRRTAEDKAKYDLELIQAGTQFDLCFELLIDKYNDQGQLADEARLVRELAISLEGLELGAIGIGMKKRRGFGRCHIEQWQVWQFDMTQPSERLAWLTFDRPWATHTKQPDVGKILDILKPENLESDQRERFTIHALFSLNGSLLIRSGQATTERAPDVVHLKSKQAHSTDAVPVLSGTSLAGVLRHRAERIVNTLGKDTDLIEKLFGNADRESKQASRLVVYETKIQNGHDLVQNRIAIDRFTGGAYHGALFDEQPVFGGDQTLVTLQLELRLPQNHEIGLLLLLLKDLWTEDLPVGGESSIGRGRLQGKSAVITRYVSGSEREWTIVQNDEQLQVSNPTSLEKFVEALTNYTTRESAA